MKRAILVLAIVSVGCGDGASMTPVPDTLAADSTAGTTLPRIAQPEKPAPSEGTRRFDDERFDKEKAFWGSFAMPSALEYRYYKSFDEMVKDSTLVIVGHVVGDASGPVLDEGGDGRESSFQLGGAVVKVDEHVAGEFPVGGDTVIVGAMYPEGRKTDGPTLMFVRWGGTFYEEGLVESPPDIERWDRGGYGLVSSQGLFIQGPEGAWNPISTIREGYREDQETPVLADPVAEEVRYLSLGEVISRAESAFGG